MTTTDPGRPSDEHQTERSSGTLLESTESTAEAEPAASPPPRRNLLRRGWFRWLLATAVVLILILVAVSLLSGTLGAQQADDPAAVTKTGSAAVAQLLRDQGVTVNRTDDVDEASASASGSTLLIVHPERLQRAELLRLLELDPAVLVLIRPQLSTLTALGIDVSSGSARAVGGEIAQPGCADPSAQRAGSILVPLDSLGYSLAGAIGCYQTDSAGMVFQRLQVNGHPVDVLGAAPRNETLDQQGNAAFALGLLGSRPRLVWLMARVEGSAAERPGLLPDWWTIVVAQAVIGAVVLGAWRGRRLGPIISERLPVVVSASETVEGHGHLYHRLSARDRAAAALRAGLRARLGPRYGQPTGPSSDPRALAHQLAIRTGRDPVLVQSWLNGPPPTDDEQLINLARNLDQLEQEAQQL